MRTEIILAICGLLMYIGKLLDDYYVPDNNKKNIAAALGRIYESIKGIDIPDVPARMANWFFQPLHPSLREIVIGISILFYCIASYILIREGHPIYWYVIPATMIAIIPLIIFGVFSVYIPARYIFIFLHSSRIRLLRTSSVPMSVGLPILLYFYASNNINFDDIITSLSSGYWIIEAALSILLFSIGMGAFLFYMVGIIIVIAFTLRIIILFVDVISQHLLRKAQNSNKPFGYTAALFAVILAIAKVIDEIFKT